jgi:hypothetical protein
MKKIKNDKFILSLFFLLAFSQAMPVFGQENTVASDKGTPASGAAVKTEAEKIKNNYVACPATWLCLGSLSLNGYSFIDIGKTDEKDLMINGKFNVDVNIFSVDFLITPKSTDYSYGFLSAALGQGLVGAEKVQFWKLTTGYQTSLLRLEIGFTNVWLSDKTNIDNTGIIFGVGVPIVGYLKDLKK